MKRGIYFADLTHTAQGISAAAFPLGISFGGPNFPLVGSERHAYLSARPAMDFYIQIEGEVGFVDLVYKLDAYGFDMRRLKAAGSA